MKLVYYRGAEPNFGDDLNPALWPVLAPGLIDGDPRAGFVGIGTIIGMVAKDERIPLHVFSSGAGYAALRDWEGYDVTYWCVRGPITARMLGLPPDRALTDGAILTPLAKGFPGKAGGDGGTVVVPHWESLHFPGWAEAASQAGFELLDPRGNPHSVIARIAAAKLVLTESLHGAILADAYGVPWVAFSTSGNFSTAKWTDWCASVGLDVRYTLVPPPEGGAVLRFGRAGAEWGETRRHSLEDAAAAMSQRLEPSAPERANVLKAAVKNGMKRSALLRKLLGYTPSRTAAALNALAGQAPLASRETTRRDLQARMLERLAEVERAYRQA